MSSIDRIKSSFKHIYQKVKKNPHLSEEAIKRYFYKEKILEELEEDINQLVYKLYGLNKKDQKVIEKFLQKF